ncbi:MAG: DUF4390 domain-containing protein [Pseudomonadota bacterium]
MTLWRQQLNAIAARVRPSPAFALERCRLWLFGVMLALASGLVSAEQQEATTGDKPPLPRAPVYAKILEADTALRDDVFLLRCKSQLELPESPAAALSSGLPLVFVLKVEMFRDRAWWFDDAIAQVNVRYQLQYFELTNRYQVTRMDTGFRSSHFSLDSALQRIGALDDFALIEARYLEEDSSYRGAITLSLDAEALPLPLRPQAYVSPQWRFSSEEYTWYIR